MHDARPLSPVLAPRWGGPARGEDAPSEVVPRAGTFESGNPREGTTTAGVPEVVVYRLPLQDSPSAAETQDGGRDPALPQGAGEDEAGVLAPDTPPFLREQARLRSAHPEPEWIEPVLHQNAVWFCRLRWTVIAVLTAAGLAGFFPGALDSLGVAIQPTWPLAVAILLAGLNLAFIAQTRRAGEAGSRTSVRRLLWTQIVSDLLVLTAVIHWLGSGLPAVPFMYLFHIILACMVFSPRQSLSVAGLAAACFLGCLLLESAGVLERRSVLVGAAAVDGAGRPSLAYTVAPMLLTWLVIWHLVSRLASALRARDRALHVAHLRLKASIEERSKHMLQTTHQLKAPFAAIHAQTQLLLGHYCGALPEAARAVAERISARCQVLARQIQEMLQLANLRSQGQTAPPRRELDLRTLIAEAIHRVEPVARQRGVRFEKSLPPLAVRAVEDHLTMVVDNLVVNAVNYSFDRGVVEVSCREQESGDAVLVVRDHGIGIAEAKLARIFDDYYRTEEAVQHNRSSTGLGLAIVRQVACENRWPVTVESAPGWGTRFTVAFSDTRPRRPASSPSSEAPHPPSGGVRPAPFSAAAQPKTNPQPNP